MKKYLLFDLDGTLTDPKIGITTCVQYALRSFGIEEPDLDKLEPFIGPPLKESFMEFYDMSGEQAEAAVEKYRERFRDIGLFENEVYSGIPQMLRTLKAKGMHLAVASSKPTVFVERILQHFHLEQYFEAIVGSELDGTRVNKDEVVQEALRHLFDGKPIQKDKVYMIGDRKFDVEGARAHGIESVGVAYGYGDAEELTEAKADYIVFSVGELKDFLLREIKQEQWEQDKKLNPIQRILEMALPILVFLLVRSLTMRLLYLIGSKIPGLDMNANVTTIMSALSYVVAALSLVPKAVYYVERGWDERRLNYLKRESALSYVLLVLAGVGAVLGLNLLFSLAGFLDASASYQEVAVSQYAATMLVGLVCYGFLSPIAEEILFRGILYNCMRHLVDAKMAVIVSSLIFGLYHRNWIQGVYGFLMGCLIAYGYEYFGSFKIPVILHMLFNLLAYGLTYMPAFMGVIVNWPVCIVCLVVAVVCLWRLHRRKNIW